jgi:2-amino-4-hydroxy-6-hydroxymethyldihydropteridine diphosphokinase
MPTEPTLAAIALGSNLGDRARNLEDALAQLAQLGEVTAVSSFHDTAPELYLAQPRFLNAAALLSTTLLPLDLLAALLGIEQTMGRKRTGIPAKGPRLIDLDLLLYGHEVMSTGALTLPHPALHERRFVLAPLAEIAPALFHPVQHQTIAELLQQIPLAAAPPSDYQV